MAVYKGNRESRKPCVTVSHIPVWDRSERENSTYSRSDFKWHKRRGLYVCPNGKVLRTSGIIHDGKTLLYRASKRDCHVCLLKMRCCPKEPSRKIPRDLREDALYAALLAALRMDVARVTAGWGRTGRKGDDSPDRQR